MNPFLPLEFILEILSFATVAYLILAGKEQRRVLLAAGAISIRKAAYLVARMRHLTTAFVRKRVSTTRYHRSTRLLPILLISFVSLLPSANAAIGCCDSPAPDPFQPYSFAVSVAMYGLAIWFLLGVGRKEFRSSIYRYFVIEYNGALRALVRVAAAGLMISMLVITPVFAGGDNGGGGGGGGGSGGGLSGNPFATLQFLIELVSFAVVFYLTLSTKDRRRRIFTAAAIPIQRASVYLGQLGTKFTTYVQRQSHD